MRQTKTNGAKTSRIAYRLAAGSFFIAAALLAADAYAEPAAESALKLGGSYTADVTGTVSGGLAKRGRVLDDFQISADLDLDKAVGWKGASAHVLFLNNSGAMPNEDAGTLQGVDNIEVGRQRARLFEAWVEQGFGDKGSVRAGLYDLNSEFYANDSAGLLIAPAFGIGSELAATGPNGPSIFPSTALAVRARWTPNEHLYAQAAVLNANAGVLGDPGGIQTSFDNGVLAIAEAGWQGRGKVAFGTWRYSDKQDDIRLINAAGEPVRSTAKGAYVLLERELVRGDPRGVRRVTAFARLGVSDGDTTAFKGGWQAGLLVQSVFESRPDSAFSVGVNRVYLSNKYRRNALDLDQKLERSESAIEVTYSDKVGRMTIQPDLQYVKDPGADGVIGHALIVSVRFGVEF
ncbi:MAG: porin [Rhizobium sp.]|nr:MAG: porin [Rhizobium sp.]